MSAEDEIRTECRLYAIEWAIGLMLAAQFQQMGASGPVMLEQARQQALAGARRKTFSSFDPAMSDLLSAELEAAIDRLLTIAKEFLAKTGG